MINPFYLFFCLRVIYHWEHSFCFQCFCQIFHEFQYKLQFPITKDFPWNFIKLSYFVSVDFCYAFWGYVGCYCLESDYLCKSFYYYHNSIHFIWFWQWSNNVNTNLLSWFLWYVEWVKFSKFLLMLDFILLTFYAPLNIFLDVFFYS